MALGERPLSADVFAVCCAPPTYLNLGPRRANGGEMRSIVQYRSPDP